MAKYKPGEYANKKLLAKLKAVQDADYSLVFSEMVSKQQDRIFNKGIAGDGREIGTIKSNEYVKQKAKKGIAGVSPTRVNLWFEGNFKAMFLNQWAKIRKVKTSTGLKFEVQLSSNANNPQGKLNSILERFSRAFIFTKAERKTFLLRMQQIIVNSFK